jgi:hypothetical protein
MTSSEAGKARISREMQDYVASYYRSRTKVSHCVSPCCSYGLNGENRLANSSNRVQSTPPESLIPKQMLNLVTHVDFAVLLDPYANHP